MIEEHIRIYMLYATKQNVLEVMEFITIYVNQDQLIDSKIDEYDTILGTLKHQTKRKL